MKENKHSFLLKNALIKGNYKIRICGIEERKYGTTYNLHGLWHKTYSY